MNVTRTLGKLSISALLLCSLSAAGWGQEEAELAPPRPPIDVAICLDTSASMQALIDEARLTLWDIISGLSQAQPTPRLRVALLTYAGRSELRNERVRVDSDLTDDLDLVSERLFEVASGAGNESVRRALKAALEQLDWSPADDALKLIFVVGNEPADQEVPQVSLEEMSDVAYDRGISVSAIYCGGAQDAAAESWRELVMGQGQFATIDHRSPAGLVETPFDRKLAELSKGLSETYIALGEEGKKRRRSQAAQDENAEFLGSAVAASRAEIKSGRLYSSDWDLVHAVEVGKVGLHELDESELPEVMREMTVDQREIYVQDMGAKRDELRRQIAELARKRRAYVAERTEAQGLDDKSSLDGALRRTIRQRAEEKGFHFPER